MVLNICIKGKRRTRQNRKPKSQWQNLKGENLMNFKNKMMKEGSWCVDEETNICGTI